MTEAILVSAADWLLTYVLHSSLLLGGVWLVQRAGVLRVDAHRELAWKLALLGAVLSASLQLSVVGEPLSGTWDRDAAVAWVGTATPAAEKTQALAPVAKKSKGGLAMSGEFEKPAAVHSSPGWSPRQRTWIRNMNWPLIIVSLWLSGVLLIGFRQVYMRLLLEKELSGRRPIREGRVLRVLGRLCEDCGQPLPRISVAAGLPSPIVLARGEICVPMRACTDLHESQLEAMLAHELAHLQRRDPWWLWACSINEVLFFFQPLNRLARREIIHVAEFLTDRRAVAMTTNSRALAECLAEVAGWMQRQPPPAAMGQSAAQTMAMAGSVLPERVRRLAANKLQGEGLMTRKLLIPMVVTVAMVGASMLPGVDLFSMDVEAGSTSRHVWIDDDEDGRMRIDVNTSDKNMAMELDARGEIEFAPDDSDITAMDDGDYFDLTVVRDGDKHRARIEGEDGRLVRSWWVNGDKQLWNAEAAAWFATILPEVFRRTGLNAEQRVAHMLDTGGVNTVLDEIELLQGDYTRRVYFTVLMEMADPISAELTRAVRLAGNEISSDFELRSVLVSMLDEPGLDDSAWTEFFAAARGIGSDYEQRTVLTELAERIRFNKGLIDDYLENSASIGSDFEMRQALTALLDRADLDEDSLILLLQTTAKVGSDFEQASILEHAVPQVRGHAIDAYLAACGEIGSDFEQRRALEALVQHAQLSSDEAIRFLDASTQIGSDFELASLLLTALPLLPDDPGVRQHYEDVAKHKLGSSFERNRVMAALDD